MEEKSNTDINTETKAQFQASLQKAFDNMPIEKKLMIAERLSKIDSKCMDCKIETMRNNNYYMIHNELWNKFATADGKGFLCVECLEKRMGRKLTKEDLTDCIANKWFMEQRGII